MKNKFKNFQTKNLKFIIKEDRVIRILSINNWQKSTLFSEEKIHGRKTRK